MKNKLIVILLVLLTFQLIIPANGLLLVDDPNKCPVIDNQLPIRIFSPVILSYSASSANIGILIDINPNTVQYVTIKAGPKIIQLQEPNGIYELVDNIAPNSTITIDGQFFNKHGQLVGQVELQYYVPPLHKYSIRPISIPFTTHYLYNHVHMGYFRKYGRYTKFSWPDNEIRIKSIANIAMNEYGIKSYPTIYTPTEKRPSTIDIDTLPHLKIENKWANSYVSLRDTYGKAYLLHRVKTLNWGDVFYSIPWPTFTYNKTLHTLSVMIREPHGTYFGSDKAYLRVYNMKWGQLCNVASSYWSRSINCYLPEIQDDMYIIWSNADNWNRAAEHYTPFLINKQVSPYALLNNPIKANIDFDGTSTTATVLIQFNPIKHVIDAQGIFKFKLQGTATTIIFDSVNNYYPYGAAKTYHLPPGKYTLTLSMRLGGSPTPINSATITEIINIGGDH